MTGTESESETLFRTILETSIDGILVISSDREYVTYNQQFLDLWGVPAELVEDQPEEVALEWALGQLEEPEEFLEKVEYLYEHPEEESRDQIQHVDGRVFDRYSAPVVADDGTHYGRVWFFQDVTERVETLRELERQNERLEEFASVISHDLRNPLNVAEGHLEMAMEEYDDEHLEAVAEAHGRIEMLVEDLLTLARQGKQIEAPEPVELARLVEECWRNVETGDATLDVETASTVMADESRLEQLLENLFRNAIEHGGEAVTVTVGDREGGFYVEDDGPGIPAAEREQVLESGYSTKDEGTGFGLSIVQTVAEAHGWEVSVTDGASGGARFEFSTGE